MKDNLYKYKLDQLGEDVSRGKPIVLYLGAGVNCSSCCDMSWPALLSHLELASGMSKNELLQLKNIDNELRTSIIKRRLGVGYIHAIQNFLYTNCNEIKLAEAYKQYRDWKESYVKKDLGEIPFYSLFVLADIIVSSNTIKAVVTQNYDRFLTYAIDLMQQNVSKDSRKIPIDIFNGQNIITTKVDTINIYHVHGLIPAPDEVIPDEKINHVVLSKDETFDMLHDVYSWQTGTQLHFFSHYTVLLLGLSLTDMTTLRLISFANANHKRDKIYYFTACSNTKQQYDERFSLTNDYFNSIGINVVYNNVNYSDLYYDLLKTLKKEFDG